MKKNIIFTFSFLSVLFVFAQEVKKLGRMVTNSVEQEIAPVISADGRHLLFMLKGSHGRGWGLQYSVKKGSFFQRGTALNEINQSEKLNLMGGYCLSADGSELYFTSKKHGGLGAYDIWKATRKSNNTFGSIENLGKPINTNGNEGAPSISADGNFLYFMKSTSMEDETNIQGEIWVSERQGNRWGQAKKLPFPEGYSYPKIFVSNNYLLLTKASQGKIQFCYSKRENGQWQSPKVIESFKNEINQPFASISHYEKALYFSKKDASSSDLCQGTLAKNEQATPVIAFRCINQKTSEKARIIISEWGTNQEVYKNLISHSLDFYIEAGKKYDIYIENLAKDELFIHEVFDATQISTLTFQKRSLVFQKVAINDTLNWTNYVDEELGDIVFDSPQKVKEIVSFLNKSPFKYEFIKEVILSSDSEDVNTSVEGEKQFIELFLTQLQNAGLNEEKYELKIVENENPRNEIMLHVIAK